MKAGWQPNTFYSNFTVRDIVLRGTVLKSVTVTSVPVLGFDCF